MLCQTHCKIWTTTVIRYQYTASGRVVCLQHLSPEAFPMMYCGPPAYQEQCLLSVDSFIQYNENAFCSFVSLIGHIWCCVPLKTNDRDRLPKKVTIHWYPQLKGARGLFVAIQEITFVLVACKHCWVHLEGPEAYVLFVPKIFGKFARDSCIFTELIH